MKLVNPYNGKLLNIVKLIVLTASLLFVVFEFKHIVLVHHLSPSNFIFNWQFTQLIALCMVIILLPFNIGIESIKWQKLIAPIEKQPWQRSFQSICIGITLGFAVSPIIGDLAAKATSLVSFNKVKAAVIAFIGNTAQLLVSLIAAAFASGLLLYFKQQLSELQLFLLLAAIGFVSILLITIYINMNKVPLLWKSNKIEAYFHFLQPYSINNLLAQLGLSTARYFVFLSQFVLLSIVFQIHLPLHIIAICASVIFGIQALLPNMILVEIGVRGAASLFIFGLFISQPEAILLTTYSLWFINRCIPGIAGWIFLARYKPIFA